MSVCFDCTPGYTSTNGSGCVGCPAGRADNAGTTGCALCAAGTFTDLPAQVACTACAVGRFTIGDGSRCDPCAAGFFFDGGNVDWYIYS